MTYIILLKEHPLEWLYRVTKTENLIFPRVVVRNDSDHFERLLDLTCVGKNEYLSVRRLRRIRSRSDAFDRTAGTSGQEQAGQDKQSYGHHIFFHRQST